MGGDTQGGTAERTYRMRVGGARAGDLDRMACMKLERSARVDTKPPPGAWSP